MLHNSCAGHPRTKTFKKAGHDHKVCKVHFLCTISNAYITYDMNNDYTIMWRNRLNKTPQPCVVEDAFPSVIGFFPIAS